MDSEKNIVGKYQLGKVLGTGDFDCTIRVCTHVVTGQQFAVRVYSKTVLADHGSWQQLADAVQVVRTLPRSERIVETVECFETASYLYILMAFAPGISLYKLLVLGPNQLLQHGAAAVAINNSNTTSGANNSNNNNNNQNNGSNSSTTQNSANQKQLLVPNANTPGGNSNKNTKSNSSNNNNNNNQNNSANELILDQSDKKIIFLQVLQGLQHLHSHDVAHMSLAPDHILIHWDRGGSQSATKFAIRIGFLVACKKVDPGQKMRHLCGTNHTVAPEVLRQTDPYDPFLADIWSAGVVLYFMLSGGKYPFDGANTSKHILAHDVRPLDPAIPAEARELVHQMMHPDPSRRPPLAQVLEHSWLNSKAHVHTKNMQSVIQNAVTARRDEATGKIIVRVMPLMFPRKELAARIIQVVWRFVRYRPRSLLTAGREKSAVALKNAAAAATKSNNIDKKHKGKKQKLGDNNNTNNNKASTTKKHKSKITSIDGKEDAWGDQVESGSDLDPNDSDHDTNNNSTHYLTKMLGDVESDDEDDDDDTDGDGEGFYDEFGKLIPKTAANAMLRQRMKMIQNNATKSTVPPMPTSLIAHDVRCMHCGRVPPTTFQSGKHPFPQSHFHFRGTGGFQDRDEVIRQEALQVEQEMAAHFQHQQQQQLMFLQQQQQQQQQQHQFLQQSQNNNYTGNNNNNNYMMSGQTLNLQTPPILPLSLEGRPMSAATYRQLLQNQYQFYNPPQQQQQQHQSNQNYYQNQQQHQPPNFSFGALSTTPYQQLVHSSSHNNQYLPSINVNGSSPQFFFPAGRRNTQDLGMSGFYDNPTSLMSNNLNSNSSNNNTGSNNNNAINVSYGNSKGERAFMGKQTPATSSSSNNPIGTVSPGSTMNVQNPSSLRFRGNSARSSASSPIRGGSGGNNNNNNNNNKTASSPRNGNNPFAPNVTNNNNNNSSSIHNNNLLNGSASFTNFNYPATFGGAGGGGANDGSLTLDQRREMFHQQQMLEQQQQQQQNQQTMMIAMRAASGMSGGASTFRSGSASFTPQQQQILLQQQQQQQQQQQNYFNNNHQQQQTPLHASQPLLINQQQQQLLTSTSNNTNFAPLPPLARGYSTMSSTAGAGVVSPYFVDQNQFHPNNNNNNNMMMMNNLTLDQQLLLAQSQQSNSQPQSQQQQHQKLQLMNRSTSNANSNADVTASSRGNSMQSLKNNNSNNGLFPVQSVSAMSNYSTSGLNNTIGGTASLAGGGPPIYSKNQLNATIGYLPSNLATPHQSFRDVTVVPSYQGVQQQQQQQQQFNTNNFQPRPPPPSSSTNAKSPIRRKSGAERANFQKMDSYSELQQVDSFAEAVINHRRAGRRRSSVETASTGASGTTPQEVPL